MDNIENDADEFKSDTERESRVRIINSFIVKQNNLIKMS